MDQIKQLQKLAGVSEASVNISLNGTNSAEIQDLMGIFQKDARAPLPPTGIAKPPISITPMDGPDLPDVKAPMGLDGPLPPMPPPKPMGLDMDKPSPCSTCGGIHSEEEECGEGTEWDNSPKEEYQDTEFMTKDIAGGINGPKNPKDIRVKDPSSMEESTLKEQLWKALQEKYFTEFDGRDEGKNEIYPKEEQSFSGRSDRTYFIIPNEEDYTDIQNDNRFAKDIEVPDENADIMALPNSKARKLKMMYGNKVQDLGTDYDEAVAQMERKARRRHLAGISRTRAGGSSRTREALIDPKPKGDRTYFVVPNDDDYMDIQDDSRFAGDIEVPDENNDIMALPNSKANKLKRMYGNKVEFLGNDYDEAVAKMSQEEGYQTTPEKDLVGKQHKLPNEIKAKILAAPEDGEEDSEKNSMYDEEMNRIRELSGLQTEEDNKKPDEDGDGVPDWADKKPGKDDNEKKSSDGDAESAKARRRHLANISRTKARGRK